MYKRQAFGLDPKKRIKSLSTGYASIVKLIVTLSSGAEVLIVDEPVLGLDAGHRSLFYKEVLSLYGEKGCTVVLSTHIIEEISDLLESVIILEDCRVLASESVDLSLIPISAAPRGGAGGRSPPPGRS